ARQAATRTRSYSGPRGQNPQTPSPPAGPPRVRPARAGTNKKKTAGPRYSPVRIGVGKIPKRYQPLVVVCPVIIEGTDINECLNIISVIDSQQIAKGRITGRLGASCHDGVKPRVHAVPKDRDPIDACKLAPFADG